jgi:gamma-glutamyltranspeptidase/glutathione hydrolase
MLATSPGGSLSHLIGAMGGDAQPHIHLQVLARMLAGGQDPATALAGGRLALSAPRAEPFRLWWGEDLRVLVEDNAPPGWEEGLTARGHRVNRTGAFHLDAVGCSQIIAVGHDPVDGSPHYVGAADPRSPSGGTLAR